MAALTTRPRMLVIAVLASAAIGCAAIPAQEMSDARQAIQAAREVGAENYARDELDSATRLMEQAEEDLNMGFFSRAQQNAAAAKAEAMKARDKALSDSHIAQ